VKVSSGLGREPQRQKRDRENNERVIHRAGISVPFSFTLRRIGRPLTTPKPMLDVMHAGVMDSFKTFLSAALTSRSSDSLRWLNHKPPLLKCSTPYDPAG